MRRHPTVLDWIGIAACVITLGALAITATADELFVMLSVLVLFALVETRERPLWASITGLLGIAALVLMVIERGCWRA